MSATAIVHAKGPPRADRVLCGFGYADLPILAEPGLLVTCPDCKEIISHCQDQFTLNYRARRATAGEPDGR